MNTFITIVLVIIITSIVIGSNITKRDNINFAGTSDLLNSKSKVLSRRKRFLIFPDGSSFQLVFCTQNHGYLQIGDIVWFGTTAALAWELPTDPQAFSMFRDRYKVYDGNRRTDIIYYVDEDGKVVDSVKYSRKPIVNPAFAKRSVTPVLEMSKKTKISIKEMHSAQSEKSWLEDLDASRIDFHRIGRKNLYIKLEKFFQQLGWNGRICVLKMLCEAEKARNHQGTFVEEILTSIFTLPKGRGLASGSPFDGSHGADADCKRLYPECLLYGP